MTSKARTAPSKDAEDIEDTEHDDTDHPDTTPEDSEPEDQQPEDQQPEDQDTDDGEAKDKDSKNNKPKDEKAADDASADEDDADDRAGAPARRSVARLVLQIGPAVALLVVSVLLVMVWRENTGLSNAAQRQRELSTSAGKVASTFFNWDHRHMKASFDAKYPLLTKKAADAIRPTAGALTSYFTANKVGSQANINGVYPGDIRGDQATVVVVLNTKVTTAKSVQSNNGATVSITMKRVSGKWLADNITMLSSGMQSITDPNGKPLENGEGSGLPGVPSAKPSP